MRGPCRHREGMRKAPRRCIMSCPVPRLAVAGFSPTAVVHRVGGLRRHEGSPLAVQAIWQRSNEVSSNTLGLAEHACLVRSAANRGDAADTQQQQHEDDVVQPRLVSDSAFQPTRCQCCRSRRACGRPQLPPRSAQP